MKNIAGKSAGLSTLLWVGIVGLVASCATMAPMVGGQRLTLTGAEEVPAVTTTATGNATITKTGDNTFASAPDAKLTEAQYESYKQGKLYVNVHSAKNPGGEIRAQIKGNM